MTETKRKPGPRPRFRCKKYIAVYLEQATKEEVGKRAEAQGKTDSDYVLSLIQKDLRK